MKDRKRTQPLSKLYHILVKRQSDSDPIADLIAEREAEAHRPQIEGAGGAISVSRTYQVGHSYIVVSGLPDSANIEDFFDIDLVKEVQADA